jgi:hypothetical protein
MNYIEILKHIKDNREILTSLFEALSQRKLNALKMLHEICMVTKSLDVVRIILFINSLLKKDRYLKL